MLALGLPGPGYITVNPDAAHSRFVAAIDFQFDGDGEAAAVYEWAEWFDVSVTRRDGDVAGAGCRPSSPTWVSSSRSTPRRSADDT